MAHRCPDCDKLCHCGGNIDDIDFGGDNSDCDCPCWRELYDEDDEPWDEEGETWLEQ
jgi:hypothetical protein